jgi:hypothetical protein
MLTSKHVQIGFANPFLICNECKEKVPYWHDPNRCGPKCNDPFYNFPCEHTADVTSICPSWGPVDGCRCKNKETHK